MADEIELAEPKRQVAEKKQEIREKKKRDELHQSVVVRLCNLNRACVD